jgi:hypothetical protein
MVCQTTREAMEKFFGARSLILYMGDFHLKQHFSYQLPPVVGSVMNDMGIDLRRKFELVDVHRTSDASLLALQQEVRDLRTRGEPVGALRRAVVRYACAHLRDQIIGVDAAVDLYLEDPANVFLVAPTIRCPYCGHGQFEMCKCCPCMPFNNISFSDGEARHKYISMRMRPHHTEPPPIPEEFKRSQAHHIIDELLKHNVELLRVRIVTQPRAGKIAPGAVDLDPGAHYMPASVGEYNLLVEPNKAARKRKASGSDESTVQDSNPAAVTAPVSSVHAFQGRTIQPGQKMLAIMDKCWDPAQLIVLMSRVRDPKSLFLVIDKVPSPAATEQQVNASILRHFTENKTDTKHNVCIADAADWLEARYPGRIRR